MKPKKVYLSKIENDFNYFKNLSVVKKYLGENASYEAVRMSIVCLYVYFDDIRYTLIEEMPSMTVVNLLSDMGGILGIVLYFLFFLVKLFKFLFFFKVYFWV